MSEIKSKCNAYAHSTGEACKAKALANGKCRNHGGLSTGPKTAEGKERLSLALTERMHNGQKEKAMSAYQAWLASGGREILRRKSLRRELLKRIKKLHMQHVLRACASRGLEVDLQN